MNGKLLLAVAAVCLAIFAETESADPCLCTKILNPVCGVDGKTYGNLCLAGCEGVAVAHEGECAVPAVASLADEPVCFCPQIIDPVCGADGKTYDNGCYAYCENVVVTHAGSCDGAKRAPIITH